MTLGERELRRSLISGEEQPKQEKQEKILHVYRKEQDSDNLLVNITNKFERMKSAEG